MPTLLVKNIHTLVTMDEARREIPNGALFVRDNVIEEVGTTAELPDTADEVLDLNDRYIVLPGLINTHHHFFQVLTRAVKANGTLFPWLETLYPIWAKMRPNHLFMSAQMAAAELMLSGCTTASDHCYVIPNDCTLDDDIKGVQETGLRFHACRGSMSVGEKDGGLPPDSVVNTEDFILKDCQRLIEKYHDDSPYSMLRIDLGPCSPFSVSRDLMRESAKLARSYSKVRLHTHLAENQEDIDYSQEHFGLRPGGYLESVGWLQDDCWFAHCVQLNDAEVKLFGEVGAGVSHCPSSNMRLASGAAPIRAMLDNNVRVSIGVDGSASNDCSNLLHEVRQAFLLARVREVAVSGMSDHEALEIATLGGAKVLGRDDLGCLAPGKAADFIAIDTQRPSFVGAHGDPIAATVLCEDNYVDYSFINGKKVVDQGRLTTLDFETLVEKTRQAAIELVR